MSDMSLFYEDVEVFLEESEKNSQKVEDRERRKNKFLAVACLLGVFLLMGEFLTAKVIKPSMSSPRVTVSGQQNYTAQDIAIKLLPINAKSWWSFDVKKAVSILSSEPAIAKVTVVKSFPDKIVVKVKERQPVAMTFVVEGGKSKALQIDSEGVLFPVLKSSPDLNDMPIISGIPMEHVGSGTRVPQKYKGLIEQINRIQNESQKYFASISEICVVPKEFGNYELVLIPSNSHVRILTDRTLSSESLNKMMVTLDVIKELGQDIGEVDLRYGSVSYRLRTDNAQDTIDQMENIK